MSESNDELTYMSESPWHIDPVPAAGEDEDDAAVAEEGEQENDPHSTSERPPKVESEVEKLGRITENARMMRGRICHQSKRSLQGRKGPGAG